VPRPLSSCASSSPTPTAGIRPSSSVGLDSATSTGKSLRPPFEPTSSVMRKGRAFSNGGVCGTWRGLPAVCHRCAPRAARGRAARSRRDVPAAASAARGAAVVGTADPPGGRGGLARVPPVWWDDARDCRDRAAGRHRADPGSVPHRGANAGRAPLEPVRVPVYRVGLACSVRGGS